MRVPHFHYCPVFGVHGLVQPRTQADLFYVPTAVHAEHFVSLLVTLDCELDVADAVGPKRSHNNAEAQSHFLQLSINGSHVRRLDENSVNTVLALRPQRSDGRYYFVLSL